MTSPAHLARLTWLLAAWLSAAAAADEVGHLEVRDHLLALEEHGSRFSATIDIELGTAVEAALHNGVPLTLVWRLELLDRRNLAPDEHLWSAEGRLRMSYRALSRYYSMTDSNRSKDHSYPGLRAMLADIESLTLDFPPLAPVVAAGEDVLSRFRIRLDIGELPPPLRLPAYLSERWRLDSGWVDKALH